MSGPGRPTLRLGPGGMLVGWHGPLGPVYAHFERWSRAAPQSAGPLARPDRDLARPPLFGRDRDGLFVLWCEDDGAWMARLGSGGPEDAKCVLPDVHHVALAGQTLFGADAEGIVALDLVGGTPPERVVRERRAGVRLSACVMRNEAVLVYAYVGDASWGTVVRDAGTTRASRHQTSHPVESLDLAVAGSRAAVGLGLAGGRARLALLGPEGKVVERPHAVFHQQTGALEHPAVLWVERRFWLLARDSQEQLVATASDGERHFTLPQVDGPFAAAYYASHVHVLEVAQDGDDASLHLWRCDAQGRHPQQRRDPIEIPEAAARRRCLEARGVLRGLGLQISRGAGYRGRGVRATLVDGRSALQLAEPEARVHVALEPREAGWRLDVRLGPETHAVDEGLEPARSEPERAPSSLLKLARWVRHRISPAARRRYESERARAEAFASRLEATLTAFEFTGPGRWLEFELDTLPSPARLHRWLRELRAEDA